jgi:hypothetical protein
MPLRLARFAALAAFLLMPGCRPRLDERRSFTLEPGNAQTIDLAAISRPQRITVEFMSSAGEISVYLIKNFQGEDGKDDPPKKEQTLDMKRGTSGTVSADVSPDTKTRVVVRDAHKSTQVTVEVTNRK